VTIVSIALNLAILSDECNTTIVFIALIAGVIIIDGFVLSIVLDYR
jgi:hypothetical protein